MLCSRGLLIRKCWDVKHLPLRHRSCRLLFRVSAKFTNVINRRNLVNFTSITNTMSNTSLYERSTDRLSPLVRPVNYKLNLRPDLEKGVFQGSVKIDVVTKEEEQHIWLHSKFLNIIDVQVQKGTDEIIVSKFNEIKVEEQLFIYFDSPLKAGNYKICIEFNGDLTRDIIGFYSSRLNDSR